LCSFEATLLLDIHICHGSTDDTYINPAPQTTDSSTTSRILNVEGSVATGKSAETNTEDYITTMFLSNLLSDTENLAAYERGKITARNTQQVEMRIG
jgi:hypothetical protein